ncbi:hypothetical protein K501DRAFT_336302 [Backusella circina FSU 941]|nr:hypothetical protein K501DRAFT_336302 [Backusella circina FSU 941]
MSKSNNINWNIPDADDSPPPAYEASAPPFNPSFMEHPPSSSSNSHPHYIEPTPIHQHTTVNTNTMASPILNNSSNSIHNNNSNNNPHTYNPLYPQIPTTQHHRPLYHPIQMPMPQAPPPRQYQPTSYHTMPIPVAYTTHIQDRQRRGFPLAALFFLFGFFCPPLWVVGACCCASSRNEYESWWGKVNFVMAMGLIISSIIFSAVTLSDYF